MEREVMWVPWQGHGLEHLRLVVFILIHFAQVALVNLVAHRADHFVQAGNYCWIRDAQFFFDVFDLAPALDERLNELHLLRSERLQSAETERAVYARAALPAMEPRNR